MKLDIEIAIHGDLLFYQFQFQYPTILVPLDLIISSKNVPRYSWCLRMIFFGIWSIFETKEEKKGDILQTV